MTYVSKYKCRYCEKVFTGSITGNEKIAFSSIVKVCANVKSFAADTIPDKEPHIEPNHYGIGDLVGVEIVGGDS